MSETIARYAARAVPRYTSYPAAPHFRADFATETYGGWLAALEPGETASLYLHVPFCRQMCWYCGCNMKLAKRYGPVAAYVDALLAEIDLVAATVPGRLALGHVHFGGGTPTALDAADLARVMERVRARFDLREGAEIAIETDPRTLTGAMIRMIGTLGFTRASFGVQEFDPKVQAAINRVQPADMVEHAVGALRRAGVKSINFDLIYGLPYQTTATLVRTIARAVAMKPQRIALFGYAHVPWMAKNQRMIPEGALPDATARADQARGAAAALVAAGYEGVGIDHFALPDDSMAVAAREGRLHRNFQGYTTDGADTLIGVGASAIGRMRQGYVQNIAETGAWARAVAAGRLPVGRGRAVSPDDRLRGAVIERVMCDGRVDLAEAGRRHGAAADWWRESLPALDAFARDGLLRREGPRIALTEDGRKLSRIVASTFDRYLPSSEGRHSAAI